MTNAYDAHPRVFGEVLPVISDVALMTDTGSSGDMSRKPTIGIMKRPAQYELEENRMRVRAISGAPYPAVGLDQIPLDWAF